MELEYTLKELVPIFFIEEFLFLHLSTFGVFKSRLNLSIFEDIQFYISEN